ncbi:hypothetical protein ACP4OV_026871 [Aristida adscensionis]
MDSIGGSCSRTRSGLVRRNSILDSGGASCSRTRSGLVRIKPIVVEAESDDEAVAKGVHDGSTKDMSAGTRSGLIRGSPPIKNLPFMPLKAATKDEQVMKQFPDGDSKEEMPSRTRSGLARGSPTVKAAIKDEQVMKRFPDGEMPSITRSGLVRGSHTAKVEDMPIGTRNGLVRRSPGAAKTRRKDEPVSKELANGCMKEEKPSVTRSGLIRRNNAVMAHKAPSKDQPVIDGLPVGWAREFRPRKTDPSKNVPYYIDPVSGYEFRSMKDVHRYLQTGDIRQCAMRPKKRTIHDVYVTENQPQGSTSSQHTRPGTADKAIQCEILTSEGIMLPWEETYGGTNTETRMLPESENMEALQGYPDKVETLASTSVPPVSAHRSRRQTECGKRNERNAEVKFKKHKTSRTKKTATPIRGSPRLAALKVQHEVSTELENESIRVNLVDRVQTVEENIIGQPQMDQSGPLHANQENSFNQSQSNQADTANETQVMRAADTANETQVMHEYTTNCWQPSQADAVSYAQRNQEIVANLVQPSLADNGIPMQTVQVCTTLHSQLNHDGTMNQIQTDLENIANQVQSSEADLVNQMLIMQEYTAKESQTSHADNINQIPMIQETQEYIANDSQPCHADIMGEMLMNQESTADQLQSSQADAVIQIQIMQENMTNQSQMNQANQNQTHNDVQKSRLHLQPNHVGNPMLQDVFQWAPEQNGAPMMNFWKNVEDRDTSVPMQIDGAPAPVLSFPSNVKFQQNVPAVEPSAAAQAAVPGTASDQSGVVFSNLFGNAWSDPCIEFAFKTLTGDIPVLDDTAAVTNYFPQQPDLNRCADPNCSDPACDNIRNHTQKQVDINLPLPRPSDKLYSGSWFPPQ